jgi:hypothetical protein
LLAGATETVPVAGDENDEIPIPQIKKAILDQVIEYCTYINTNPPPVIEKPLTSNDLS